VTHRVAIPPEEHGRRQRPAPAAGSSPAWTSRGVALIEAHPALGRSDRARRRHVVVRGGAGLMAGPHLPRPARPSDLARCSRRTHHGLPDASRARSDPARRRADLTPCPQPPLGTTPTRALRRTPAFRIRRNIAGRDCHPQFSSVYRGKLEPGSERSQGIDSPVAAGARLPGRHHCPAGDGRRTGRAHR
jgi:hypothetical protein